jgi:Ger(x)C family germination protein
MKEFDNEYSDVYIPTVGLVSREKDNPEVSSEKAVDSQGTGDSKQVTGSENKEELSGNKSSQENKTSQGEESSKSGSTQGEESSSGSTSQEDKNEIYLNLNGFATFKDFKFLGYLADSTARGLNFIRSNVESGIIILTDEEKNKISMEIHCSCSKTRIKMNDDMPEAEINIDFTTNLGEVMSQNGDMFTEDERRKLMEKQNEIVKKEAESVVKYAQDNGIDILNINNEIYHQYPLKWDKIKDNWEEIFKTMKINVNVLSNINRTYHIREPIASKKEEEK